MSAYAGHIISVRFSFCKARNEASSHFVPGAGQAASTRREKQGEPGKTAPDRSLSPQKVSQDMKESCH
jgi:hypothetical protein